MAIDLRAALDEATLAAREAGGLLRADLHRSDGPRGHVDKADADTEAEWLIRHRLLDAFPGWGYLGEETGAVPATPGEPLWVVDPNDGTRDYLKGRRGSAVSIGLLVGEMPRLGVVFAFAYPDDEGDLFAWAEGCGPLKRNGEPLQPSLPAALGTLDARGRDLARDPGDLLGAQAHHLLVIGGGVADVSGQVLGLETADPVLETRRAGHHPGARERLGLPQIGKVSGGLGAELHLHRRQLVDGRNQPRLGAIGQVAVGEQEHRGHVFDRDARRLKRDGEAVGGGGGREHRHRRFSVSAEENGEEVRLLRLGR